MSASVPSRYECGVCWLVYDPGEGDPVWQVPPGTAFEDLPSEWCCPNCDAPRERFMRVAEDG
jgi:rubredoxin